MTDFKPIFTTDLSGLCDDFLSLKRTTGLKYKSEEKQLRQFTQFCECRYPDSILPDDILGIWIASDANQSLKTRSNKGSLIMTLAQHLFHLRYVPLIIPLVRCSRNTEFIPHIFTADEMSAIWEAADHIKPASVVPNMHRCIPVLFRLLYASGLRISEALGINAEDVDFASRVITIRHAKLDRERLIPMSGSLTSVIMKYADECSQGLDSDAPFFYYRRGMRLCQHQIYSRFRLTLRDANIPHQGKTRGPRLHDLRHTFAVTAMNKMADDGKDLYATLPILSAYLGHSSVESTEDMSA